MAVADKLRMEDFKGPAVLLDPSEGLQLLLPL